LTIAGRDDNIVIGGHVEFMNKLIHTDSIHLTSNKTLSCYRSINSFAVVVRYMGDLGIDMDALLAGSGIHTGDLDNPDILVTPEQELLVLRKIACSAPDPKLGLIIGWQYHVGIHGKLGAAVMSCDTVLDAVKMLFRYIDLTMTYFHYDLQIKDNLIFLRMKEFIDLRDLSIFVCEKEFASVYRIIGDIAGMSPPLLELRLAYPRPAYASFYEEIFRCPVRFNAGEYSMIFDSKFLTRKLPMSDPLCRKIFEKECHHLHDRIKVRETITDKVRQNIFFGPDGLPSLSQLARGMSTTPRTLKRHLSKEGTTYKAISADIRKKKAVNLIQTTTFSMAQVAFELGYSDPANFYRAFKSWTGHNPGYYRRNKN